MSKIIDGKHSYDNAKAGRGLNAASRPAFHDDLRFREQIPLVYLFNPAELESAPFYRFKNGAKLDYWFYMLSQESGVSIVEALLNCFRSVSGMGIIPFSDR